MNRKFFVIVILIILLISITVISIFYLDTIQNVKDSNTSDNTNLSINSNLNAQADENSVTEKTIENPSDAWQVYQNPLLGLQFRYPPYSVITETVKKMNSDNGQDIEFLLNIDPASFDGNFLISNYERGFETETLLKDGVANISGHEVLLLETENVVTETVGIYGKIIRSYRFYPKQKGTRYETYWLRFPIDTSQQKELFEEVVDSIKLD